MLPTHLSASEVADVLEEGMLRPDLDRVLALLAPLGNADLLRVRSQFNQAPQPSPF